MSFYLAIVSPLDSPLFELSFPSSRPPPPAGPLQTSSGFPSWSTFTSSAGADLGPTPNSAGTSSASGPYSGAQTHPPGPNAYPGGPPAAADHHSRSQSISGTLGLIGGLTAPAGNGGGAGGAGGAGGGAGERYMCQMVAHKSLDSVEEVMEGTGNLYLKSVDKHDQWAVSAFIAGSVKFILLHDTKNEDGIRLFFLELWEVYVKALLNPFSTVNTPIRNPVFEAKVKASAKRNL